MAWFVVPQSFQNDLLKGLLKMSASLLHCDDGQLIKNPISLNYIKQPTIYVKATGLNRPPLEHR
jgi:hypothetical protein